MITQHTIHTCMGKINGDCPPFLTADEQKEFDTIGHTGKNSQGVKSSYGEYLNSLGKGEFSVKQTKSDNGDFCETFEVAWDKPDPGVRAKEVLKDCAQKLANLAGMPYAWEDVYNRLADGQPLPFNFRDEVRK